MCRTLQGLAAFVRIMGAAQSCMEGLQALNGRLQGGSLRHPRSHHKVGDEQIEALWILQVEPMVAVVKDNLHNIVK